MDLSEARVSLSLCRAEQDGAVAGLAPAVCLACGNRFQPRLFDCISSAKKDKTALSL